MFIVVNYAPVCCGHVHPFAVGDGYIYEIYGNYGILARLLCQGADLYSISYLNAITTW